MNRGNTNSNTKSHNSSRQIHRQSYQRTFFMSPFFLAKLLCIALTIQLSTSFTSATGSFHTNSSATTTVTTSNNSDDNKSPSALKMNTLNDNDDNNDNNVNQSLSSSKSQQRLIQPQPGKIEQLKKREAALSRLLAAVRLEKLDALRSKPLTIGIVGFGRFGQFIAQTFVKHGKVVATSRSDYTDLARGMGITYIKDSDFASFLDQKLDVIVLATSIVSFEDTVQNLSDALHKYLQTENNDLGVENEDDTIIMNRGPLIVDVLSVKEFPREILLNLLPKECDILCTHPMFGPDSGKNGWHGLNFVYERTRIDGVVIKQQDNRITSTDNDNNSNENNALSSFIDDSGKVHSIHEMSEAHIEGMDRMERFLSIWEEEGCRMVPLSCKDHDSYAANSQFVTHLMGRILGEQGLQPTPIDTKGFENVLKLVGTTTADSFDLFYGLFKYNQNSMDTIIRLKNSMDDVVKKLKEMEEQDKSRITWQNNIVSRL